MKKEQIVSILKDLYEISGFRISLHSPDYVELAAYPEYESDFCRELHNLPGEVKKCNDCDKLACKKALERKSTYTYSCRYGLVEAVSPLYSFGTLTGFLMMGQVRESGVETILPDKDEDSKKRLYAALSDIPVIERERIDTLIRIMTVCAEYMTLSNATTPEKTSVAEMAKIYIYENYREKLLIKDICASIGCSKSSLLSSFKRENGVTVNAFLNDIRLSEAEKMLSMQDKSIADVAISAGFSDQSYFSKVFSAKYGKSPTEFRQSRKETEK